MEEEAVAAGATVAEAAVAEAAVAAAVVAKAVIGAEFAGIVEVEEIAVAVVGPELEVRLVGCWKTRPTPARLVRRRWENGRGSPLGLLTVERIEGVPP